MKIEKLKQRLNKNCPLKTLNLTVPDDIVEDLKKVAVNLGFSNYEALIRAYIGQGLRNDLERLENSEFSHFIENLRHQGVKDEIISLALTDLKKVA